MSLRDEFQNKPIKNAKEIELQERQAFEKKFDEFIDTQLVKDYTEWIFELVKQDVRLRMNNGQVGESFFGKIKIVRNEIGIGESRSAYAEYKGMYSHAFPEPLNNYFKYNSLPYYSLGCYAYKGLRFKTSWCGEMSIVYLQNPFFAKVKTLLAEKLKEEQGLSVSILTIKVENGEDSSFYVTLKYKFNYKG